MMEIKIESNHGAQRRVTNQSISSSQLPVAQRGKVIIHFVIYIYRVHLGAESEIETGNALATDISSMIDTLLIKTARIRFA